MKNTNNILYLECRGCYFFANNSINNLSDVGNLDSLVEVKTEQYTKEYHVYTFIAENGDTFDYEALSKRIVG